MERRKVVALKHLGTSPLRGLWYIWALMVSAKVWHMPGWLIGALGLLVGFITLGGILAFLQEDDCEPVWRDEVRHA